MLFVETLQNNVVINVEINMVRDLDKIVEFVCALHLPQMQFKFDLHTLTGHWRNTICRFSKYSFAGLF